MGRFLLDSSDFKMTNMGEALLPWCFGEMKIDFFGGDMMCCRRLGCDGRRRWLRAKVPKYCHDILRATQD